MLQRTRTGAPIVSVLPSQVYGPGDHSSIGEQLALAHAGKLPYLALADVGLGFVHVDDLAAGIVAALDQGAAGRSYVLSGPRHRLGEAMAIAARLGGKRLPRLSIPNGVLRLLAPAGRLVGQANMREVVDAAAGVTYWASNERAVQELDWHPRDLEEGLRDTFEALDGSRLHSLTMQRELPIFEPNGGAGGGGGTTAPASRSRSRWAAARSVGLPMARTRSVGTPTGSARSCPRARTTTTSSACSAA